uniref:HECT domain-containing protein n=1 Tax=viral metagenome TaxID=1070528 RepID=A0A6C0KEJ3_9ZZZZ
MSNESQPMESDESQPMEDIEVPLELGDHNNNNVSDPMEDIDEPEIALIHQMAPNVPFSPPPLERQMGVRPRFVAPVTPINFDGSETDYVSDMEDDDGIADWQEEINVMSFLGLENLDEPINVLNLSNQNINDGLLSTIINFLEDNNKLADVIILNLENNNITDIEDIGKLSQLERINLNTNRIEDIPESFTTLTNLIEINLRNNKLTSLPQNLFENIISIDSLDIGGNDYIINIDTGLPNTLNYNSLLREGLKNIDNIYEVLSPSMSELLELVKREDFDFIFIRGNNSLNLLGLFFNDLSEDQYIAYLNFINDSIEIVTSSDDYIFSDDENEIEELSEELSEEQIDDIIESTLMDETLNLSDRNLNNQQLKVILSKIIETTDKTNITEISLENNRLRASLPDELYQFTSLEYLTLDNNNELSSLDNKLTDLTFLITLSVANCGLGYLIVEDINIISQLNQLESLNISSNRLLSLPENIKNLENITKLVSTNNRLNYIPDELTELTNIFDLNLSENLIIQLPESINNMTNLARLNLADNELELLQDNIVNLPNLQSLNLSGNYLKMLPTNVWKLKNTLTTLNITIGREEMFIEEYPTSGNLVLKALLAEYEYFFNDLVLSSLHISNTLTTLFDLYENTIDIDNASREAYIMLSEEIFQSIINREYQSLEEYQPLEDNNNIIPEEGSLRISMCPRTTSLFVKIYTLNKNANIKFLNNEKFPIRERNIYQVRLPTGNIDSTTKSVHLETLSNAIKSQFNSLRTRIVEAENIDYIIDKLTANFTVKIKDSVVIDYGGPYDQYVAKCSENYDKSSPSPLFISNVITEKKHKDIGKTFLEINEDNIKDIFSVFGLNIKSMTTAIIGTLFTLYNSGVVEFDSIFSFGHAITLFKELFPEKDIFDSKVVETYNSNLFDNNLFDNTLKYTLARFAIDVMGEVAVDVNNALQNLDNSGNRYKFDVYLYALAEYIDNNMADFIEGTIYYNIKNNRNVYYETYMDPEDEFVETKRDQYMLSTEIIEAFKYYINIDQTNIRLLYNNNINPPLYYEGFREPRNIENVFLLNALINPTPQNYDLDRLFQQLNFSGDFNNNFNNDEQEAFKNMLRDFRGNLGEEKVNELNTYLNGSLDSQFTDQKDFLTKLFIWWTGSSLIKYSEIYEITYQGFIRDAPESQQFVVAHTCFKRIDMPILNKRYTLLDFCKIIMNSMIQSGDAFTLAGGSIQLPMLTSTANTKKSNTKKSTKNKSNKNKSNKNKSNKNYTLKRNKKNKHVFNPAHSHRALLITSSKKTIKARKSSKQFKKTQKKH